MTRKQKQKPYRTRFARVMKLVYIYIYIYGVSYRLWPDEAVMRKIQNKTSRLGLYN